MSRVPIVVILGATGTGKSRLAIQLAKKFNGEIISADSMQVYRGLDISSNKVRGEEQNMVPHHMLDVLHSTARFTVVDYRNRALRIIDDIVERNKLPILVGGTNYYIEAVLWKVLRNAPTDRSTLIHDGTKSVDFEYTRDVAKDEAIFDSQLQNTDPELSDIPSKIKNLTSIFRNRITSILNRAKVPAGIYARSFYPMVRSQDSMVPDDENEPDGPDIENIKIDPLVVEFKLLNLLIAELNQSTTLEAQRYYTPRTVESLVHDEESRDVPEVLIVPEFPVGNEAGSEVLKGIAEVLKIRVRRIILLQVVDDEVMKGFTDDELHHELKLLDPETSTDVHPNNRRRVLRGIQVYMKYGQKMSDILEEQRTMEGGTMFGGPMRYPDACVLWLQCDQEVLNERLEKRVDEMIENGLIAELEEFHRSYNEQILKSNRKADYEMGIFQSIGLKEFHPYLMMSEEERNDEKGQRLFADAINLMKQRTKRYSKGQYKWIKNRFVKVVNAREAPSIYPLDCTDSTKWADTVENVTYDIVGQYLADNSKMDSLGYKPVPGEEPHPDRFVKGEFYCSLCQRLFVGAYQWQIHMRSRNHWRVYYNVHGRRQKKKQPAVVE